MTLLRALAVLVLLIVQSPLCAVAADSDAFVIRWFDADGSPTASGREYFNKAPTHVVKGVNIPMARLNKNGTWDLLDEPACIVVNLKISITGSVDKFQVLDSEPKDLLVPAVLGAVKQWRFENRSQPVWLTLPIVFSFGHQQTLGTLIKQPFVADGYQAQCVIPKREVNRISPPLFEVLQEPDPVYPKSEALRNVAGGCATIAFRVGPDGVPTDLDLLDAKPDQSFVDYAAIEINSTRYKPVVATVAGLPNPNFGFARFSYGDSNKREVIPECMTSVFAAAHYQPSETTP